MKYESEAHTSAEELGEIAARAKAKMLIPTHWTLLADSKPDDMVRAIRQKYSGPVIVGRDLDVITP
jgi:ribonuclease BN (tRNA processing enzyme)